LTTVIRSCQLTGSPVMSILRPQSDVPWILVSLLRPSPSGRLEVLFTGLYIVLISLCTGHKTTSNGCWWSVASPRSCNLDHPAAGFYKPADGACR